MGSQDWLSNVPQIVFDVTDSVLKCRADGNEKKIDAIFGAYRDENGKPWVMPFIRSLEEKMVKSPEWNHEYVIFMGTEPFMRLVPTLVLGKNSEELKSGRAFGVQTVSGTAALRIGAELLVRHSGFNTFYLSDPTWDNHEVTFTYGGFKNSRVYRYWDPVKRGVNFDGMLEDLQNAPENSVIILQVCAHNPTGCDLNKQQWIRVADVMKERKLFPFFDAAYQGLGTGDLEEDIWPVRYFLQQGFEMFIAQSASKNMGLYSCRTGCLTVVLKEGRQEELAALKLMITVIIRALYLCPTRHGAELVVHTLENPEMTKEWHECMKKIVARLKIVRQDLKERLVKLGTPGTWEHITEQRGMFSFTGLTRKQVAYLAEEHHIYLLPNGRANMCALNDGNMDRFANAVHDAIQKFPE